MNVDPNVWAIARQRLPLPHLMTKIGDGQFSKKSGNCPFCEGKGCFGVFEHEGRYRFKCHNTKPVCVANEPPSGISHNEIGYLALRRNLTVKQASLEYLKLAVPEIIEEQEKKRKSETEKKPEEKKPSKEKKFKKQDATEVPAPPSPPPPNDPPPHSSPDPKSNPFDSLWSKLILTARDRDKLKRQRGFSDDTIKKLGFRSNNHANRAHLEALKKEFPMEVLLAEGIYRKYPDGIRPNSQLTGWGLSKRAGKDEEEDQWDWTEPVLIPYLDQDERAFYLRPHKGGLSRPADDDEDSVCSSHVYCPFLLSDLNAATEGLVVLCEGEFKAAALHQCGIPAIAIPGISFVRNRIFRQELLDLLQRFAITDMVVCFDNEVKDDPQFADRYKADPWDRWDTPMWAEYIAIDLGQEYFKPKGGSIRIGILPDNLRENGKADFDSVLSIFVQRERDIDKGTAAARQVFQKVIQDASTHKQARDLFPSESRRIIECKLQQLFYRPLVTAGGDEELKLANRLQSIGETELAASFRSVFRCYYDRERPERDDRKLLLAQAKASHNAVLQAKAGGVNGSDLRNLRNQEIAAWEHLRGKPFPISDFTLKCEFKLHTSDGKAIRLVKIRNRNDSGNSEAHLVRLTGAEMARGPEFMRWCYDTGKACWKGGQRKLADLCDDMDRQSYLRDIFEINYYGYHTQSGMWFFGDCAFASSGSIIEADANNIFWSGGIGYQVDSSIDERGTTFEQAAPLMLSPQGGKKKDFEIENLFADICVDMFYTIGGFDAWLMLGLMFAYAAAPELLRLGGHPGVWLFGKMSGGKTTIARWIMRIWGFKDLTGVGIDDRTTPVGMNRFLAQYSCLPVWFDEYRSNHNDPQKEAVLRGAFDRNSGAKGLADHSNRTRSARIFTTPLVTGEASSSDAATRSRFGHVSVNDRRRMGDGVARYTKVQSESKHYYLIGRFIMERRPEFVKKMLELHESWMSDDNIRSQILNERVRFVYGTAYSAFVALSQMVGGSGAEERDSMEFEGKNFKTYLLTHGEQALQDVISETFLTKFWTDILSGLQRGKIKKYFFDVRNVIILKDGRLKAAQAGDEESIRVCYIAPNAVFDEYAQDLRSRSESPSLDLGDLRREMAKEPYWIPPPKSTVRVHRASINSTKTSCWVINMERGSDGAYAFPFGEDLDAILDPEADEERPPEPPPPTLREPEPADML